MYIDVPMSSLQFFRFLRHPNLRRSKKATPEIDVWLTYSKNCQSWRFMSVSCSHAGLGILVQKMNSLFDYGICLLFQVTKRKLSALEILYCERQPRRFSCDLEFLSKTSYLMTWQIMRRDTWKKKWKQTVIVPVFLLFLAYNVFLVSTP